MTCNSGVRRARRVRAKRYMLISRAYNAMQVYRARHRHTNELYAIKRSRHRFANRAHREQCLHEVHLILPTLKVCSPFEHSINVPI